MKMQMRQNRMKVQPQPADSRWRFRLLAAFWLCCLLGLLVRAVDLQVIQFQRLDTEADNRNLRIQPLAAYRGMITDRNGKPLAVSTPVSTLWANPRELMANRDDWHKLAGNKVLNVAELKKLVLPRQEREFIYLKRRLPPTQAEQVLALGISGIHELTEYRRYYPAGPVTSQLVGITGMDDRGREGMELSFDASLAGQTGREKVIQDRAGHVVRVLDVLQPAQSGTDLTLSIDLRIQYAAYQALAKSVEELHASSGSVVVVDARTGEVLAMVNQPSYNPNSPENLKPADMRNRAATDVFEPGSSMKPFTVAAALEAGLVTPVTPVETSPGYIRVDGFTIRDEHNYGRIDVTSILTKSSNVGSSKLALSLNPHDVAAFFSRFGLGQDMDVDFPGVSHGSLPMRARWSDGERAALSYGYGLSVTALQLAQAYAVLANDGVKVPLTLLRREQPPAGERIISSQVAGELVGMLETVVGKEGTASRAQVPGFRVAGKTGTAHIASGGGYASDQYVGVFAGMAPAPDPRYVAVVMINDPQGRVYYGGLVAAPVFSGVMASTLRVMQVDPGKTDPRYAEVHVSGGQS